MCIININYLSYGKFLNYIYIYLTYNNFFLLVKQFNLI